jgi:shikimate dehydrogenase
MKKFAVIGKPIDHSKSPDIFNHYFESKNIDAKYYKHEINDISEIKKVMIDNDYIGCNITSPFKESIIPYLDQIDEQATTIGSVNVVVFENEKLCGYNTDIKAVYSSMFSKFLFSNKKISIIGLGGAGKAVSHVFRYFDAVILNRDFIKAKSFIEDMEYQHGFKLKIKSEKIENIEIIIKNSDVVIYTLPRDVKNVINKDWFNSSKIFFDANYDNNDLKEMVEETGCKYFDGKEWLIEQAYHSFNHFFGYFPDDEIFGKNI